MQVVHPFPALTADLLGLARWMASYYACGLDSIAGQELSRDGASLNAEFRALLTGLESATDRALAECLLTFERGTAGASVPGGGFSVEVGRDAARDRHLSLTCRQRHAGRTYGIMFRVPLEDFFFAGPRRASHRIMRIGAVKVQFGGVCFFSRRQPHAKVARCFLDIGAGHEAVMLFARCLPSLRGQQASVSRLADPVYRSVRGYSVQKFVDVGIWANEARFRRRLARPVQWHAARID